jgi:hypothetical protein
VATRITTVEAAEDKQEAAKTETRIMDKISSSNQDHNNSLLQPTNLTKKPHR